MSHHRQIFVTKLRQPVTKWKLLNAALFERAAYIFLLGSSHTELCWGSGGKTSQHVVPAVAFLILLQEEKKNVLNLLVSFYSALKIQLQVKWLHSRSNQPQQKSPWNEDGDTSSEKWCSAIRRATGSFPCAISGTTVSSVPAWGCDSMAGKLELRSEIFPWLRKISSSPAHNCLFFFFFLPFFPSLLWE